MATYKVIQDIEAEDKLLGPLSLRQFIYAIIVIVSGFFMFKLVSVNPFLALPFIPHTIFFAVLAAPLGTEQSSEIWLLAKVRFFLKPRKRIWDQSGLKELVTITAPKKIEKYLVKDLSQTEVRSRLQALANTIDSRGWAAKNVSVNMFSQPSYVTSTVDSDRLIDPTTIPQEVPTYDIHASDDMLDEQSNPTAQNLNQLINASSQAHRQQLLSTMQKPASPQAQQQPPADYWFLNGPVNPAQTAAPGYSTFNTPQVVMPGQDDYAGASMSTAAAPTADERALIDKVATNKGRPNPAYGNMRTIQPISEQQAVAASAQPPMTVTPNPAILELANNDDLNVATIARQANKANGKKPDDGEVVISLR